MRHTFFLCLFLFPLLLSAQRKERPLNVGDAIMIHFGYGVHIPAGDLVDRFGNANSFSLNTEYILSSNYFFNLNTNFVFGQEVEEDPVAILRTPEGNIIGNNMGLAMFVLRQRGLHVGAQVGKLFPLANRRKGLRVAIGAGYSQHHIRVQDDGQSIVQITGDYAKGYDRLTGGFALTQFIGYQRIPLRNGLTFLAGFEFEEAFTKSKRDWDFSTKGPLTGNRLDIRMGLRFGFTLPFYQNESEDLIY